MTNEWRLLRHRKTQQETNVILPAFNGYLFAVNAADHWKQIRDHQAVIGVLCYSAPFGQVKPHEIDASLVVGDFFRERPEVVVVVLKVGSVVRVVDGPFIGFTGTVVGNGLIEIVLFGRKTKMKIPQHMLVLIQGFTSKKKSAISNSNGQAS